MIDRTGLPPWNRPSLLLNLYEIAKNTLGTLAPSNSLISRRMQITLYSLRPTRPRPWTPQMMLMNPPTWMSFQSPQSMNNPFSARSVGISIQLSHSARSGRQRDMSHSVDSDTIQWPLATSLPSRRSLKTMSAPLNRNNRNLNSRGNLLSNV